MRPRPSPLVVDGPHPRLHPQLGERLPSSTGCREPRLERPPPSPQLVFFFVALGCACYRDEIELRNTLMLLEGRRKDSAPPAPPQTTLSSPLPPT